MADDHVVVVSLCALEKLTRRKVYEELGLVHLNVDSIEPL